MHSPTPKMKQRKRRGSKEKESTQHRTKQCAPFFSFVLLFFQSCHNLTYILFFFFSAKHEHECKAEKDMETEKRKKSKIDTQAGNLEQQEVIPIPSSFSNVARK